LRHCFAPSAISAAVQGIGQVPNVPFNLIRSVEIGRACQGTGEQYRRVDRGDLRVPRTAANRALPKNIDSCGAEPFSGVVCGNSSPPLSHTPHRSAEVHGDAAGRYAERRGALQVSDGTGRSNDGLGGNTARIETVAAEQVSFDQCHPCAQDRPHPSR